MIAPPAPLAELAGPAAIHAAAPSPPQALTGSCQFSGPIKPDPPITAIPKPNPHFSFSGTGTCTGSLSGAALASAPISVTFTHATTAFDTCELGPDFALPGTMDVHSAAGVTRFAITVDLARLALTGPFALSTTGNGRALGEATFTPPNAATAASDCGGAGIATATLAGNFSIVSPLIGAPAPTAAPKPPAPAAKTPAAKHRKPAHRRRHRRKARKHRTTRRHR